MSSKPCCLSQERRPADCTEVILCRVGPSPAGAAGSPPTQSLLLLEGLVSNFFVVRAATDAAGAAGAEVLVVQTAAAAEDGVLAGLAREVRLSRERALFLETFFPLR